MYHASAFQEVILEVPAWTAPAGRAHVPGRTLFQRGDRQCGRRPGAISLSFCAGLVGPPARSHTGAWQQLSQQEAAANGGGAGCLASLGPFSALPLRLSWRVMPCQATLAVCRGGLGVQHIEEPGPGLLTVQANNCFAVEGGGIVGVQVVAASRAKRGGWLEGRRARHTPGGKAPA